MKPRVTTSTDAHQRSLTLAAALMIVFGLAEVVTGFTHNFLGLITSQNESAMYASVALGVFYFVSGWLSLTKRKWAATLAIVLLSADVIGRIAMVVTGLFPVDSFRQTFAIIAGTVIAIVFAIYRS